MTAIIFINAQVVVSLLSGDLFKLVPAFFGQPKWSLVAFLLYDEFLGSAGAFPASHLQSAISSGPPCGN